MSESGVRERFTNLTRAGVSNFRPMPRQEPVQVAGPFSEFWATGTGVSKIGNRFLTPFAECGPWQFDSFAVALSPDQRFYS
jgi:hypothetical protein